MPETGSCRKIIDECRDRMKLIDSIYTVLFAFSFGISAVLLIWLFSALLQNNRLTQRLEMSQQRIELVRFQNNNNHDA